MKKSHFCWFLRYHCGFSFLFPLCLLHVAVNEVLQKCQNSSLRLSNFFFFSLKYWAKYNLCYQVILAFLEQLINLCPVLPGNLSRKLGKKQNNSIYNSDLWWNLTSSQQNVLVALRRVPWLYHTKALSRSVRNIGSNPAGAGLCLHLSELNWLLPFFFILKGLAWRKNVQRSLLWSAEIKVLWNKSNPSHQVKWRLSLGLQLYGSQDLLF